MVLKSPSNEFPVYIDHNIQGNTPFEFFITSANIKLTGFTPIATSCYGLICAKALTGH